jgi:hypothetical protein
MNHPEKISNTPTIAPLKNVALCLDTLNRAMTRAAHLPGMVVMYAPSGWGKSMAASYVANKTRAVYVECRSSFTKKALLLAIANELGIVPAKTIYELTDQIAEQLMLSGRPLILDEMDHIVDKNAVEIVRDIYEASKATILMIGEELFPNKLRKWERFHNRVLEWTPAQPADIGDVKLLTKLYAPGITITDDLQQRLLDISKGAVRRLCVNIDRIRHEATINDWKTVNLELWGKRPLYTGEAPARRV